MADIDDVAILASYDVQQSKLYLCKELRDADDVETEENIKFILSVTDEEDRGWRSLKREDLTPGPDEESCEVVGENVQFNRSPKRRQEDQEDIDEILKFTVQMMDQSNKLTVTHKKKHKQRNLDNMAINNEIQNLNNKSKAEFNEKIRGIKCGRKKKTSSNVIIVDPERRKRKNRKKANELLIMKDDPVVEGDAMYDISPVKDTGGKEEAVPLSPGDKIQISQKKRTNEMPDKPEVCGERDHIKESSSMVAAFEQKATVSHKNERPLVMNTHIKLPKLSESNRIYEYPIADDSGNLANSRSSLNDAYAISNQESVKVIPTNEVKQIVLIEPLEDTKGHDACEGRVSKDKKKTMGRLDKLIRLFACCCLKPSKLKD